ncbi:MAG: aspartate--tRNA(Asn) ligase [Actinomycetia bacterium]|nr:aspartate--tRNA(Asn) ligase [Actinomycetes bacterium]
MVERTFIKDLSIKIDRTIKVQGWLQTLRDQKRMQFLILRDITGLVQIAFQKQKDLELAKFISSLTPETALTIVGKVTKNPVVKLRQIEIQLKNIKVENIANSPLPLNPFSDKLPQINNRLNWRYLDLRRKQNLLLFKVQTTVLAAMRDYWIKDGFIEIFTPKIMGSPSESGAELFTLEYFDRKAYLAQSPQFYKQMAMAAGFEKVFEIGPVFRADPSFTTRHMTEFTGVDMEMSWIESEEDIMVSQEKWLSCVYKKVKELHGEEIKKVFDYEIGIPDVPFPRVTMAEALKICKELGCKTPDDSNAGINPAGERTIWKYIKKHYDHDFVFITEWPVATRPFYHMGSETNPVVTKSFDLIACGLELATGAQREHRLDILTKQATEKGLNLKSIEFYLDFFKYGCPPHGGFGLGISRLMMVLLGINNIRETVYVFRGPKRLSP